MKRILGLLVAAALAGCAATVLVKLPPAVELGQYGIVGIVQFEASGGENEDLGLLTTRRFMQAVQEAQPGTAFLELGTERQVLEAMKSGQFDFDTVKAIGEKYKIGALVVGGLDVSPVRPKIKVALDLSALNAQAQVNAALNSRLFDASTGATVWTGSRSGTWTLASMRAGDRGGIGVNVSDPEGKYREMVVDLVRAVTRDFNPRYERRKAVQE
ncbi:MAG: hypothetical protein AB1439_00680 [candidate division FCPU426 bacterium]